MFGLHRVHRPRVVCCWWSCDCPCVCQSSDLRPGCRQAAPSFRRSILWIMWLLRTTCTLTDSVPGFVGCVYWLGLQIVAHVFVLCFLCLSVSHLALLHSTCILLAIVLLQVAIVQGVRRWRFASVMIVDDIRTSVLSNDPAKIFELPEA